MQLVWPSYSIWHVCRSIALTLKLVDMKGFNPQILDGEKKSYEESNGSRTQGPGPYRRIHSPRWFPEAGADCLDYSAQESAEHHLISLQPSCSPWQTWAQR